MNTPKEPKTIVGELRSFCQRRDQVRSDIVHELSQAYAAHCHEANQRLRICDELLHKGLRAEAIQMAEEEPVLLELVATLQFPELASWEELAAAYAYASPPRILLQSAEAINRAYAEYERLKPLMKEHRRLALSRAGLDKRLSVLRKLVQMDSANSAWQDDLSAYEEARQRQLRVEIDGAFSCGKDQLARTSLQDLISSPWRTPLTPEFLEPVIQQYFAFLARKLEYCQNQGDLSQARQLLGEWSNVTAGTKSTPNQTLVRRVKSARTMIEQDDNKKLVELQFGSAVLELEKGIKEGCRREELEGLYAEVCRFGRPIPKSLYNSYSKYLRELTQQAKRSEITILIGTAIVGGLVLLFFLVFLYIRNSN